MHTVELLEQAMLAAERLGYKIRQDWLAGCGGGRCEFAGQQWIFLDLTLSVPERLDQIAEALGGDPAVHCLDLSSELRSALKLRKSA